MISLASVRDVAAITVGTAVHLVVDAIGYVRERLLPDLGNVE